MSQLSVVFRAAVILVFSLSMVACSTFSRQECEEMDWVQKGYDGAVHGKTFNGLRRGFKKACTEKHDVPVKEARLRIGYDDGLKEFCTGTAGFNFGKEGGEYAGTCKGDDEANFFRGYQVGQSSYLKSKIESLESKIRSLESDLSSREAEISDLEAKLNSR